jgi:glycosyltransferase involved in cell wall biosynthesis
LLVDVRNADALARGLEVLLADGELRRRLGAAARERAVSVFSKEAMQDAWRDLYERQYRAIPATRREGAKPEVPAR